MPRQVVSALLSRRQGKRVLYLDRVAAAIESACLEMLFGSEGALKGVLVELGSGWQAVSLLDPDEDPRVVAGQITYINVEPLP